MNPRPDIYVVTERQRDLLSACIESWRSTTFWVLMYMQSFLFRAENVDNIGRELDTQPARYELIFAHYYGEAFSSVIRMNTQTEAGYFRPFLLALRAGRGTEASEIKRRWLEEIRYAAAKFGAMNPFWSTAVLETMLTHYIRLVCASAEDDMLGKYQEIGQAYLVLDQLAKDLGEYFAVGIIRQFKID